MMGMSMVLLAILVAITLLGIPSDQRYYVTFEFTSGSRLELDVPEPESGMLVVGDQGTLAWQGPRYLGFAREILR